MQTAFNPDEARRFAQWLDEETSFMLSDLRSTSDALKELQSLWNDVKYTNYLREFESIEQKIFHFGRMTETFAEYLRKKAEIADRFLE